MIVPEDGAVDVNETEEIDELSGKLSKQDQEDKLMNSILDNDEDTVDDGKMIKEALNHGLNSFTPDLMFGQLVKNYSLAKQLFGPTLIKQLTGYNDEYVKRNIKIPEFQREVKQRIVSKVDSMMDSGIITDDGSISDKGVQLASLVLYTEELDSLIAKGVIGEKTHKKHFIYGDKQEARIFRKGDRYKDIAIKNSAKVALRRGHTTLHEKDLRSFDRESKGQIYLIYGLDASGSMKGKKIEMGKKAGIALAYKAIEQRDSVGLLVFGSDVKEEIEPTDDFIRLLTEITKVTASRETNISATIKRAIEMFPSKDVTKHLILITDAMPTSGENPDEDTLDACAMAVSHGITISLIGINLTEESAELAQKMATIGEGKLYTLKNMEELDTVVLEDYYSL